MRPGGYALDFAIDLALRHDGEIFLLLKNISQSESSEQKYFWLLAEDEDASRAASADAGADLVQIDVVDDVMNDVVSEVVDDVVSEVVGEVAGEVANNVVSEVEMPFHRAHLEGRPIAPAILEYAANNQIDLIVMETYGHRSLGRLVFGGTAEEVVRWSKCPVLAVRKQASSASQFSLQHILVPVDFSRYSRDAHRVARDLAVLYEASIQLLFVYEERPLPLFDKAEPSGVTSLNSREDTDEFAAEALKNLHDQLDEVEVPVSYHVRRGHVSKEILDFAATQACDLIITTSHGLTDNSDFTLGSVAEKVIRRARCPVLTLKASHQSVPESAESSDAAV